MDKIKTLLGRVVSVGDRGYWAHFVVLHSFAEPNSRGAVLLCPTLCDPMD